MGRVNGARVGEGAAVAVAGQGKPGQKAALGTMAMDNVNAVMADKATYPANGRQVRPGGQAVNRRSMKSQRQKWRECLKTCCGCGRCIR